MGQDPFAAAERDTEAMVSAGWWPSAPLQQRQHAIAGRMLVLPDGTWWLFGAWARWYRMHPSDGQWYLCPPPLTPATRQAARPAQQGGQLPALPPHVIPAGPDFQYDQPKPMPFVGHGFSTDLSLRVRATIEQAAALPAADYPHWWGQFSSETPSTVAVAWGVMLWCAAAPVFDAQYDEQMLDLWVGYRAKPLPDINGPRWLTPPPLEALVGLYAERLRSSRVDAAVSVLRTMWAMASALRDDDRFRARADALLAILGATLNNPTVDYGALPYGDQALVQQWLTRCPPHLAPALRDESSPGDNVRHSFYHLAEAVAGIAGNPSAPGYLEPRLVAAALLAADLAKVRQDVAGRVVPWLDPEIRYTVQAVHGQAGHPQRRLWPVDQQLPEPLRANLQADPTIAEPLLAAAYRADLAWCRLAGIPARPRGFPVPIAIIAEIIGVDRARATAKAAPSTPGAQQPSAAYEQPSAAYAQPSASPGPQGWPSAGAPGQSPGAWPGAPQNPAEPGGFARQPEPGQPYMQGPAQPGTPAQPDAGQSPWPPYGQAASPQPGPGGAPDAGSPPYGQGSAHGESGPGQAGAEGFGGQPYGGGAYGQPGAQPGLGGVPEAGGQPYGAGGSAPSGAEGLGGQPYGGGGAAYGQPGAQPGLSGGPEAAGPPYGQGGPAYEDGGQGHAGAQGAGGQPYGAGGAAYGQPGQGAGAGGPQEPSGQPYGAGGAAYGQLGQGAGAGGAQEPGGQPYGQGGSPYGDHGEGGGGYGPGGAGPQAGGEEAGQGENWVPPYTQLGMQRAGQPYGQQPPSGGAGPGQEPPYGTQQPYESQQPQAFQQPPGQPGFEGHQPGGQHPGGQQVGGPQVGGPGQAGGEQAGDPFATRIDGGSGPPKPAGPPRTRVLGQEQGEEGSGGEYGPPVPARPGQADLGPGTRVMSETMIGDFDYLDEAPVPSRPVHEIAPPPERAARRVVERYGISFVSGEEDVTELLDELRAHPEWGQEKGDVEATRIDGKAGAGTPPSVLLVGSPHSGQRRLARLIALTLADMGIGDGAIRTADAADVRGAPAEALAAVLEPGGPTLLFERLDAAILESADPAETVRVVRSVRARPGQTTLIATCEPRHFKRLAQDHPKLLEVFRPYRLPDLGLLENRMTLLHLLADERRVTIGGDALVLAEENLGRLRGPGDLINARLVEAYLDQAVQRHLSTAGAARDRLALTREDLAGVAEAIEPALRQAGDIDGYLAQLDALMGLEDVKQTVEDLVAEARLAVERARHGVRAGGQSRHLIFLGPPGTGKTTIAGLLGGIYAALGLLDSGHVVACRPVHLAGRDELDTENRVAGMAEQATGGVLLIQEAYRLDRSPAVVRELLRQMDERRDKFMVVCTSPAAEMEGFLAGNPGFRSEFGAIIDFPGLDDRQLVRLFQSYAERDLYLLDEELRVELLSRFARMRERPDFAYARTARALFEQTVARQAARLAGADVNAATVARLTARDLPETPLEQILGDFQQQQRGY